MMWFELKDDERLGRCTTSGCGGQPTWRLEAEGHGSNFCSACRRRILMQTSIPETATHSAATIERLASAHEQGRLTKRDGNFLDEMGCCKVCDGEIPDGHQEHCDILKIENKHRNFICNEYNTVLIERDSAHEQGRREGIEMAAKACENARMPFPITAAVSRTADDVVHACTTAIRTLFSAPPGEKGERIPSGEASLHRHITNLHWMARRYVDGRMTYAVGMFNDITRDLLKRGILTEASGEADGTIWARDGSGKREMDGLSDAEAAMGDGMREVDDAMVARAESVFWEMDFSDAERSREAMRAALRAALAKEGTP